jgi:IS30 family transposase
VWNRSSVRSVAPWPYDQLELDVVAARLNTRPRKILEYQTPADRLASIVAPTA